MISQMLEGTIQGELKFSFFQFVHISHNTGREPTPRKNTCKSNTFVSFIVSTIQGESKLDIDDVDKIPYRGPWRIKLKERIWPPERFKICY